MTDLLKLLLAILASLFKSRAELEAEILVLRQQVNVLRRRMPKRPALTNIDRLLFVWLYRWFPTTVSGLAIVRPETVVDRRSGNLLCEIGHCDPERFMRTADLHLGQGSP